VQKRLVVLHTPQGRKILLGDSLKWIENGVTRQHSVPAEQADRLLVEEFALSLPA
jgi:hypothetical protein